MEITTRSVNRKDGTVTEIMELSEIANENEVYAEIRSFVRMDESNNQKYCFLKIADLDKEQKSYEYLSVECIQENIFKAIKTILKETYNFKSKLTVTKRKLKQTDEKKNQFAYTMKFIFDNYDIPRGDYLYHDGELIKLYGNIDERINKYKYKKENKTVFSINMFDKKERYDGEKFNLKENISKEMIKETLKLLVNYEMGMSAKETFLTCIGGYSIKCELFDNEIDIDFEIEGETPDETDKLFYEKHKDLQSDAFSELMYGINVFELFSKIKRGLSDETIISACQLVGYKQWFDNTDKAKENGISNSRTENVPDKKTIQNIRIMVNRLINFIDREGTIIAMDFPFGDEEKNGYSDVISEGEGEFLTENSLFIIDISNNIPDEDTILKIVVHYIMANISQKPVFDEISKIGILNPRLNVCYSIYTDNIPISLIRELKRDLICYR